MFNILPTLLVDLTLPNFASPDMWLSLITLTFLEIVLGVDNIIFVSIVANQLPKAEQPKARNYGLILALVFRLVLLLFIGFILSLDKPIFELPFMTQDGAAVGLSIKDLILLFGGLFLIYKSTQEIGEKLEGHETDAHKAANNSLSSVIFQICVVNIVFSFDSILTAMGMTQEVAIMMIAVIISIAVMMMFSAPISTFINQHPTMQMLALSFLILIGVMLVAEAFHQHVSKGYIYFAIAFSMGVEILNMRMRKANRSAVKLNSVHKERAELDALEKH
ncbi:MAG: TerC family protein [Saprospiraceae bacterium]|nr:TerC family protein [Saprospiraceae bacterium]